MTLDQVIASVLSCISTACAVVTAIFAITTIHKYKTQRAFDLFTAKRLKNYDSVLKAYQELMTLSSVDYINMATAASCDPFFADYEVASAKLSGSLSTTEKQEYYMLREYGVLQQRVKAYADSKTAEAAQELEEQRKRVLYFTDIYLWALWNYMQRLRTKKKEDDYHDFYEEQFQRVFNRSKELNASETSFFKDYKIDMLVDHCALERTCRKRCRYNKRNR